MSKKRATSTNEIFHSESQDTSSLEKLHSTIYSKTPQETGTMSRLNLDDSFDITRRLNQLRMSIGLDKVPSPRNAGNENTEFEKEANFGGNYRKNARIATEGGGRRKSADKALSRYLGFYQTEKTEHDMSTKPYITDENMHQEVFTLGPAHRSITELFEEADPRVVLSPKKTNVDDKLTPRKSYKVSSANKSPNVRNSTKEDRGAQAQRNNEAKPFEVVKREVQEIQKELERANREQDSPLLNRKYSEAATPFDRKAPISKMSQKQYNTENKIDTQRTEAVEEEYRSIIARVNSHEKSPNMRMQQLEEYYKEENEKLRKRLEEETAFYKQQISTLTLQIDRFKQAITKEHDDELNIRKNSQFYKYQAEELDSVVTELKFELKNKMDSENFLQQQIEQMRLQHEQREELLKAEAKSLRRDIETLEKMRQSQSKTTSDLLRDQYIYQIETDLKLLRGQLQDLSERKSSLEVANETLLFQMKTYTNKVQREFELKYQKDIRDYKSALKGVTGQDHTRPERLSGSLRKNYTEEAYTMPSGERTKTTVTTDRNKPSIPKAHNNNSELMYQLEDLRTKLKQLESENFSLREDNRTCREKCHRFELQAKNYAVDMKHFSGSMKDQNTRQLRDLYDEKIADLTNTLNFWRDRCSTLAGDFFSAFKQLKEENEAYKSTILDVIYKMKADAEGSVRRIKKAYKKELSNIVGVIEDFEEKHNSNQAKLADARSKYKNLEFLASLNTDISETVKNPRRRESRSAKRKT